MKRRAFLAGIAGLLAAGIAATVIAGPLHPGRLLIPPASFAGWFGDAAVYWDFTEGSLVDKNSGLELTFARASDGTYFDSAGTLQTAGTNEARFDHDPITGESLGLLIEESRINRALHNRDFSNAAWVKSNITAAKDAVGIDNVANSASSLTASAGNGTVLQTVTIASAEFTTSVYVKCVTCTGDIDITDNNGGAWTTLTGLSSTTWTRHDITRTQVNPVFGFRIVTPGDEIEVDFAQLEPGAFPTSPIATTTTAVTRAIDRYSTSDLTWFNESVGTWFLSGRHDSPAAALDSYLFEIGNTLSNDNRQYFRLATTNPTYTILDGAAVTANMDLGSYTGGDTFKMAGSYAVNDIAGSVDGGSIVSDTSASLPATADMNIFVVGGGQQTAKTTAMWIKSVAYWDVQKPDAFLQQITQ